MMDETFKDWWASQPSIDYEEMCIASEAWDYQDKRISTLRAEVAELKAANRWISVEVKALREVAVVSANVLHHGGLLDDKRWSEARRLTLPYWDKEECSRLQSTTTG